MGEALEQGVRREEGGVVPERRVAPVQAVEHEPAVLALARAERAERCCCRLGRLGQLSSEVAGGAVAPAVPNEEAL